MVFSETNTREGLIQECERICNLSTLSGNTLKDFTARINQALDRFYTLAFKYDTTWTFDDSKNTDFPIATTNLVSGQTDYKFASDLLQVTGISIKDQSGNWSYLDEDDYKLIGNSIIFNDAPTYSLASALKVNYKRNGTKFSSTDGGVAIGIPSLFHAYLARYASYPYAVEHKLPHAPAIAADILRDEAAIRNFISNRAGIKPRLGITKEDNR